MIMWSKHLYKQGAERISMAPKQDLVSLVGHTPVIMADSMEEMNEGGEKCRKWHSRNICCAVLHYILYTEFSQILKVL